ncbi:putative leucine-rich repeat receptor-like serine/threonine-protein kinase At2g24130 [Salvia hispanica]|uniref:putative leucine-rich repeat receptor-like serine/threonine-protein kinase At2g24130 n=1 Tax=Salvia hispanica TaxID=49212 RepID=UPI0020093D49|nr:putative leucine-rich repeat receptor-like serine/threonine-protein kinase At2g24130 [Salvia hispanica]
MHVFLPHSLTIPSISKPIMDFSKVSILFSTIVLYMLHSANDARVLDERVPLLSFMSGITSDPGHALANWNASGLPLCEWSGVGCDMTKNRVVELNLSHKSLRGTISPALFALSQLEILDLSGNFLHGQIPPEIGSLDRLKELSLSSNSLRGNIPFQVGSLNQLVYLNLGSNKLDGEIPASLFCNASSSLQYLDLSNNSLNGELPKCALSELKYLLLWSNGLVGEIPPSLSNSTKLEWLDLESNHFEGELPTTILSRMPHLKYLYLSYNHFSSHDRNTNLAPFFTSLNNSSPNLQELDLAGNHLGGALPPIIGNLSALVQINLDTNFIHGEIPPQISNLVNLTLLNLSSNLMNGTIPSELSQMAKLERLYLSNNSLSGHIPASLGNMPHLGLLDLSKNKLQGSIPGSFANLIQLRRLLLYENELTGYIPSSLGKCINLEILDLSRNRISGTIPAEVAGLSSLKLYLNLSSNMLTGHIPLELSKMDMVLAIDVSNNNLSGALPSQLGSCIALETLNVSHNALEGQFPGAIGSLPYLREIDVSFNRLNGEIPESLQASASLKLLNFSYNSFRGNVTSKGSFASLTVESFLGNEKLCGSIEGMRSCRRKRARHFLMAILLSLLITPIFCVVGFPLLMRRKLQLPVISAKAAAVMDEEEAREEIKYPRISRRKLGEATGGFSSSSLIGSGRFGQVYKGILEDNTRIAVKVLNPKTAGEMRGSFKRECQVLKRTRHRNLIRIITACSRPDFKALVLPLMPNGSLEDHLYPADGMKKGMELDLPLLVGICCDVAQGMAYLHHYAPVKVVHCDLKPSNILLDHDMTALVADFGIARLVKGVDENAANCVDESASYDSTHGLLCGSVGYIAPEYGMGRHASPQGDVYSYGVLVLEIAMGKRPTDVLFQEGSSMHEWVKSHYPNKLGPMVDEAVARMARRALTSHERKVWSDVVLELVELGLICTQYSPSARPSMLDVAHEITLLKHYVTSSPSTLLIEHTD